MENATPYLVFILGWASNRPWSRAWLRYLKGGLVESGLMAAEAREGRDWDVFGWASRLELAASIVRPAGSAATDLARLIEGRAKITLIGHSKGGNLILEYLAQVAEGSLPPNPDLRRAISLNAPLDSLAGRAALARFDPGRLVDLETRLRHRGVHARIDVVFDPTDPVACPLDIVGVNCRPHPAGQGRARAGRGWGSLQVWSPNHLACFGSGWPALLRSLEVEPPLGH